MGDSWREALAHHRPRHNSRPSQIYHAELATTPLSTAGTTTTGLVASRTTNRSRYKMSRRSAET
jgi:hypothetical protein